MYTHRSLRAYHLLQQNITPGSIDDVSTPLFAFDDCPPLESPQSGSSLQELQGHQSLDSYILPSPIYSTIQSSCNAAFVNEILQSNPFDFPNDDDVELQEDEEAQNIRDGLFEVVGSIKDPEFQKTLEDLNIVRYRSINTYRSTVSNEIETIIVFKPTVPHCSQATTIALAIMHSVKQLYPFLKLQIYIQKNTHKDENNIMKQVNDKERVQAALEVEHIKHAIEELVKGLPT